MIINFVTLSTYKDPYKYGFSNSIRLPVNRRQYPAIQKLAQGIMMVILFKAFGCNQIGKTFTVHNYIQKLQRLQTV
jgi:hypothetical protein